MREKKAEYINREKDILKLITDKWDTNFPYFVRLYATFHVSVLNGMSLVVVLIFIVTI